MNPPCWLEEAHTRVVDAAGRLRKVGAVRELPSLSAARSLAERYLSPLGSRWQHTQAVAARALELARAVPADERNLLVIAGWWHDLGYAPELVVTGFHPLDGANFLYVQGNSERLCALIAHHSAAEFEAEERGLLDSLAVWPREEGAVADALWTADMTTGPDGRRVTYSERLEEILSRYARESFVSRAMRRARPTIESAVARTTSRLVVTERRIATTQSTTG